MLRPSGVIALLSLSLFLWGSTQSTVPTSVTLPGVSLEVGTPINLRLARQITSKKSKAGDLVVFQVCGDVTVGSLVVIPSPVLTLG